MGRAEKMDCGVNGEVIFTGATTEFQLKKGLTQVQSVDQIPIYLVLPFPKATFKMGHESHNLFFMF